MNTRENKKFSLLLMNNDVRTHTAFKNALNTIAGNGKTTMGADYTKSAFMEYKNNQRYPIGLTEQRFLWQNKNNKHCNANSIELKGSLSIKKNIKNSFDGGFESFYDISQELPIDKYRNSSTKVKPSTGRKIFENMNSGRVMNPKLDKTFGGRTEEIQKGKKAEIKELNSALGGISNLLAKTPESSFAGGKKRLNASFESGINIFSKDYHMVNEPYVRTKKLVEVQKATNKNGFAGVRTSSSANINFKNSIPTKSNNSSQKIFYSALNTSMLSEFKNTKTKQENYSLNRSSLNKTSTASTTILSAHKKQSINSINSNQTISNRIYNPPINNHKINSKTQKALNRSSYIADRSSKSNTNDL